MSGFSAGYFPKMGCHYNQATVLQRPKALSASAVAGGAFKEAML